MVLLLLLYLFWQPSTSLMMHWISYSVCYFFHLPICQSIGNNIKIYFMLNHYNHVVGCYLNERVMNSFLLFIFRLDVWMQRKSHYTKIMLYFWFGLFREETTGLLWAFEFYCTWFKSLSINRYHGNGFT